MDVIVPVKENRMFLSVRQLDEEMIKANANFNQTKNNLNRMLDDHSKISDTIRSRFEVQIFNCSIVIFLRKN